MQNISSRRVRNIAIAPITAVFLGAVFFGCSAVPTRGIVAPAVAPVVVNHAAQLNQLYEQFWEETLKRNPLRATNQGDTRYNDLLPNTLSAEFRTETRAFTTRWLDQIQAVGPVGLSGQDLISYQIFVRRAKNDLEGDQFPDWQQPINQFRNIASSAVQLGSGTGAQPFKTVADYDNWLMRGNRLPILLDQAIANMRVGMANGIVQPRALMLKVLPQLDALIKPKPQDTLFWEPINNFPTRFSAAEKARLSAAYLVMVGDHLMPAYRRLRAFVADEYLAKTRASAGFDALPNGKAWYAYNVRQNTTTEMTPDEIHALGLQEVARLHQEIRGVMAQVEFSGSLQDFFKFMQEAPRFNFADEAALLSFYRGLEAKINRKIPEQFSLIPKAPFEIRPVEAYRAQSAAGGQYQGPSEDGKRAGIFYVNTYDLPTRKTWDAEDLFLHEAIPGHHFQIALAQELTELPKFRRFGGETAFSEGWGLYAESLGKDLGVYTDPYDYFGYAQNELWRAIRLVVDTGIHSRGWSREQVIQYMLDNSAESVTQSTAEAERYMAIPGQALAYKIGELKIQALRAKAQAALGSNFDVRAFHAEVLKDGSVPLAILEAKIGRWLAANTANASTTSDKIN
jgi:uncharacterized protein (DUF885 family)